MIGSKRLAYSERKLSDTALDGLFGGLAGGVAMAAYLVIWGLMAGLGPGAVLGLFDARQAGVAMRGALTHLAVASVYGIVFGLIWWALQRGLRAIVPAWLVGIVYGLLLLLVARAVVLPAAGSALAEIPTLHFALAHAIYGAALGWAIERMTALSVKAV
jgi:hypothetical protein